MSLIDRIFRKRRKPTVETLPPEPPEGFELVLDPFYGGFTPRFREFRDQRCRFWRPEWSGISTFKLADQSMHFNVGGLYWAPVDPSNPDEKVRELDEAYFAGARWASASELLEQRGLEKMAKIATDNLQTSLGNGGDPDPQT